MLQVPMNSGFTSFSVEDLEDVSCADGRHRIRSHSLVDSKDLIQFNMTFRRPRSRSFYTLDHDKNHGNHPAEQVKKELVLKKPEPKRSTTGSHKHPSKDHAGTIKNLKNIPMLTISEPDSWKIIASSEMKYGHYVDWEKIDPESASRFKKILFSSHSELKEMGRSGFWVMPHTLRAKSYQHLIGRVEGQSLAADSDRYNKLAMRLFENHGMSTHPFPKFMEDGEIPRYCLNKSGRTSVKKILLCLSENFPEVTFCPILPALVSLLLHYSEDEAQCFHSICSLVTYSDPDKRFIDHDFVTTHASCMTFGDLANKYCRGIRKLIASSRQSLFEFYSDWIMWIFADLPFSYAIRVLDVYLIEGYKVLYRVALALLSLYKVSVSSRVALVDDFKQDMKRFVENVGRHSSVEALLQRAFSIQLPTRKELNFLYNVNKEALIRKGIHHKSLYQSVELRGFCSKVVSATEMRVVWAWLPERFALFGPTRIYSSEEHTKDLVTFYSRVEGHTPTVLLLKTVDEEVCGVFLSSDWTPQSEQSFGTGESFVFTLRPAMERYQRTVVHVLGSTGPEEPSSSSASRCSDAVMLSCSICPQIIRAENHRLYIGDGGHALSLSADLTDGQSESCDLFQSPVLCRGKFRIQNLEVWGIQHALPPTIPTPCQTEPYISN